MANTIDTELLLEEVQTATKELSNYKIGSDEWLQCSKAIDRLIDQISKVDSMGQDIVIQRMKCDAEIRKAQYEYEAARMSYRSARREVMKDFCLAILTGGLYLGGTYLSYNLEEHDLKIRSKELGRNIEEIGKRALRLLK